MSSCVLIERTEDEVLRIRREDIDAHEVNLIVQGRVFAEWADLLERECEESIRSGFHVVLDLSDVVSISRSGIGVLGRLVRAGVRITRCPPLIAAMLEHEGIPAGRTARRN